MWRGWALWVQGKTPEFSSLFRGALELCWAERSPEDPVSTEAIWLQRASFHRIYRSRPRGHWRSVSRSSLSHPAQNPVLEHQHISTWQAHRLELRSHHFPETLWIRTWWAFSGPYFGIKSSSEKVELYSETVWWDVNQNLISTETANQITHGFLSKYSSLSVEMQFLPNITESVLAACGVCLHWH